MDIEIGMKPELDSPYIMRYHERFEVDGETFVIMNYYSNGLFALFLFFFIVVFIFFFYVGTLQDYLNITEKHELKISEEVFVFHFLSYFVNICYFNFLCFTLFINYIRLC
jgi:hypothetical protein